MPRQLGESAIVIGAGIAGLAAARAVAEHFARVRVLERDVLPSTAIARAGVPQGDHVHVLLRGGQLALEALFPGFEQALLQAGAVAFRAGADLRIDRPGFDPYPRRDAGWKSYAMSRPLLERCVRSLAEHDIELRPGCRVERVMTSADRARVLGVECTSAGGARETLTADLVIDASGRGALTLAALEANGYPLPEETCIEVDLGYATGTLLIPAANLPDWSAAAVHPSAPASSRGALLLPIEDNRWLVTLGGRGADRPPGDWDGFRRFARELRTPTIHDAIRHAESVGTIERFGFRASVWRHFERLATLPLGLLPLGDAICRFNPLYGQGMSVAALEACALRRQLGAIESLEALARGFFAELPALLQGPWGMAAVQDFAFPDTRGDRPADLAQRASFGAALTRLAALDPAVHRLTLKVQHLLTPSSALAAPDLRRQIAELMVDG